jgi:DNA-binding transcriptional LysR family regulator
MERSERAGGSHDMNLRHVDLNLLLVLDTLLAERNVTLAAVRLGVSQSTVSSALAKLRTLFHDDLFSATALRCTAFHLLG